MEEKSQSSKWLIGCGIGCAVVIVIGIIIVISGYFLCRGTVQSFQQVENTQKELEERYGSIEEYTPSPDGRIDPERIEIFLQVRDSMKTSISELDTTLRKLEQLDKSENEKESFWDVVGGLREGFGMVPDIADFYLSRNNALLSLDMSPGEYYYIYVMAYYSYLGKSPDDGPGDQVIRSGRGFTMTSGETEEEEPEESWEQEMRSDRGIRMRQRIRWRIIPILENQLNEIEENPVMYSRTWRNALEKEINKLKDDRDRIPWEDELPEQLRSSLEPYKGRLEESYNPVTNIFELMQQQEWND